MKVRSTEELYDVLSADLAWRKKELSVFRAQVDQAGPNVRPALLRASVALLYAHWEGYIKLAATAYLTYLGRLRLSYEQLRAEIAALALRSYMNDFSQANRSSIHALLVRKLREDATEIAIIPTFQSAVRTGANLNFRRLEDILVSIGCDCSRYEEYVDLIDEQLLAARNRVVHGEGDYMRLPEWEELRSTLTWIMDDITAQILNAVVQKSYLAL